MCIYISKPALIPSFAAVTDWAVLESFTFNVETWMQGCTSIKTLMLKLKLIHPKCARFSEKHSHQHVDHMLKQIKKCLSSQTLYFTAVICVFSTVTGVAHHMHFSHTNQQPLSLTRASLGLERHSLWSQNHDTYVCKRMKHCKRKENFA